MSNMLPPPRTRTSSTARAPAMPLPMTTSFFLSIRLLPPNRSDFQQADVNHECTLRSGWCREEYFEPGLRRYVLDEGEGNVLRALCCNREIAHRLAVAHEHKVDHLGARISGAHIDELRAFVRRDLVHQLFAQRPQVFIADTKEWACPLEKLRLAFDH